MVADRNYWCRYCGKEETEQVHNHLHHIIPKSIGGKDTDGRVIVCPRCHFEAHCKMLKVVWWFVTDKEAALQKLHRLDEAMKRRL